VTDGARVSCDCEELAALRYHHLQSHFMKTSDYLIPIMQNFALHSKHRSAGGLNTDADAQQIVEGRGTRIFIRPSLIYSFDNAQALDSV
jgi:hypothetical protein